MDVDKLKKITYESSSLVILKQSQIKKLHFFNLKVCIYTSRKSWVGLLRNVVNVSRDSLSDFRL